MRTPLSKKQEVSAMSTVRGQARAVGIPFDGNAGPMNAIIDVDQVCVGHDQTSAGDTQTGVTAILPIGNDASDGIDTFVLAAFFCLNGNGEMTGTHLIEEMGFLEGPIVLTNTVSLGDVRSWVIKNAMATTPSEDFGLIVPVVAETDDSYLNNSLLFNVTQEMVDNAINKAIKNASPDNLQEGNVGGGTGMTCYSWKGGIGTASRQVIVYQSDNKTQIPNPNNDPTHPYFTVGVLVQANQGNYWDLVIRGVPMGQDPQFAPPPDTPDKPPGQGLPRRRTRKSSIIVVIATDAPLLPHQRRVGRDDDDDRALSGPPPGQTLPGWFVRGIWRRRELWVLSHRNPSDDEVPVIPLVRLHQHSHGEIRMSRVIIGVGDLCFIVALIDDYLP